MTKKKDHEHLYTCLGTVISMRRKRLGMSQDELAKSAGITRPFISNVEQGQRNPSIGALTSIASALKTKVSRVMVNCEQCMENREKPA